jgi:hypothetical protein
VGQVFSLPSSMPEYTTRLPHFHPEDAYLFLTWRLWGSLPAKLETHHYSTPGKHSLPPTASWTQRFRASDSTAHRAAVLNRTVAYIEENPVSAGLVSVASRWPWSSAGWQTEVAPTKETI